MFLKLPAWYSGKLATGIALERVLEHIKTCIFNY